MHFGCRDPRDREPVLVPRRRLIRAAGKPGADEADRRYPLWRQVPGRDGSRRGRPQVGEPPFVVQHALQEPGLLREEQHGSAGGAEALGDENVPEQMKPNKNRRLD